MIKCVNPRMIVFAAASLCGAAYCVTAFSYGIDAKFWIAGLLAVFSVVVGVLRAPTSKSKIVFLSVVLGLCCALTGVFAARYQSVSAIRSFESVTVRCVVTRIPGVEYGDSEFGTLVVNRLEIDGKRFSGNANLILSDADPLLAALPLGEGLRLTDAQIEATPADESGVYTTGARYTIRAGYADCLYEPDYRGGFFERIRYSVTNAWRKSYPTTAGVAAALLFGDKSGLGFEEYQAFRLAGLAHALAVSGLHVGFLIAVLGFLTARLKRFRALCFALLAAALIAYAAICGGAVSVVRAVIMGVLAGFAAAVGRRSDPLNNLAVAAILILVFNPCYIRSLSFDMSFLSVAGIILVAGPLSKRLRRLRLPAGLANGFAVTTGATLGILPVTAAYFHTLNLWSLLVNLIALPLIELCFILSVAASAVAVCGVAGALAVPDLFLRGLSRVTSFCAELPGADFLIFRFSAAVLPYFAALILFGGLILFRGARLRKVVSALSAAVLAAVLVGVNIPKRYENVHIGAIGGTRSVVSVTVLDGKCCVVGKVDGSTYARLDAFLAENRVREVDVLMVVGFVPSDADSVARFAERYRVGTVAYDFVEENPYLDRGLRCDLILTDEPISADGFLFESALDSPDVLFTYGADSVLTQTRGDPCDRFAEFVVSARPTEARAYYRNVVVRSSYGLPERAVKAGERLIGFAF